MAGLPLWVRNTHGTTGILAAMAVGLIATWAQPVPVLANFALASGDVRAWPYLTYPFVIAAGSLIFAVLAGLWAWSVGSQLERQIGTRPFLAFFAVATVVSGVVFSVSAPALAPGRIADGPLLPVAALTCAWAAKNRLARVSLFGVIPVPAAAVAVLAVLSVAYSYGFAAPLLGLLCCVPSVLAWFWGAGVPRFARREAESVGRGPSMGNKEFDAYRDKVRQREKEREEQERLRRLFEGGGDPPKED